MQCMGKCDAREAAGRGCRVWNGGSEVHRARGGITLIDEDTPGVGASAQKAGSGAVRLSGSGSGSVSSSGPG